MTRVTLLLSRYRVPLMVLAALLILPAWLRYFAWVLGGCNFWVPNR